MIITNVGRMSVKTMGVLGETPGQISAVGGEFNKEIITISLSKLENPAACLQWFEMTKATARKLSVALECCARACDTYVEIPSRLPVTTDSPAETKPELFHVMERKEARKKKQSERMKQYWAEKRIKALAKQERARLKAQEKSKPKQRGVRSYQRRKKS